VCLLDFQILHPGKAAEDLAYMLTCGCRDDVLTDHEDEVCVRDGGLGAGR
jgi:hypothetical protein